MHGQQHVLPPFHGFCGVSCGEFGETLVWKSGFYPWPKQRSADRSIAAETGGLRDDAPQRAAAPQRAFAAVTLSLPRNRFHAFDVAETTQKKETQRIRTSEKSFATHCEQHFAAVIRKSRHSAAVDCCCVCGRQRRGAVVWYECYLLANTVQCWYLLCLWCLSVVYVCLSV